MKLRNKNTGEVIILIDHTFDNYNSLAEMMDEWEDYKPTEPLIKARDVRHILKQWASTNLIPSNSNEIEVCLIDSPKGTITQFYSDGLYIQFWGRVAPSAIHGKCYSIDELCGEEKE